MADASQLPYLLKLVDDDSETVRSAVRKGLLSFGFALESELEKLPDAPTRKQRAVIDAILAEQDREWLLEFWSEWYPIEDRHKRLEAALALLSEYLSGRSHPTRLPALLDQLADEFRQEHPEGQALDLAAFLFREKGLTGAPKDDYHSPETSNLIAVIERKRGIPISLASVYILVAARLGLDVEGCNFPSHFLARARVGDQVSLIDCFDGGKPLAPKVFVKAGDVPARVVHMAEAMRAEPEDIILRSLRNLSVAFRQALDPANHALMNELAGALEARMRGEDDGL